MHTEGLTTTHFIETKSIEKFLCTFEMHNFARTFEMHTIFVRFKRTFFSEIWNAHVHFKNTRFLRKKNDPYLDGFSNS